MTQDHRSYRQILRATSIIGSASIMRVLIGMVRMKAAAILIGPAGVGLVGILSNIMTTAGTIFGCGLGNSGVRQLAANRENLVMQSASRRALWYSNIVLGLIGMFALWSLRQQISIWVFGDTSQKEAVGWIGLGVLFLLISGSQTALVQGLRLLREQALMTVFGTLLSSIVSVMLILFYGSNAVAFFVIAVPIISAIVAVAYLRKLPFPRHEMQWGVIWRQFGLMIRLGLVFMMTAFMQNLSQLLVRSKIAQELGLDATGHFQAAWTISMTYIGFVLSSMGADFYPKLSAIVHDRESANRLVNEQARVAVLLAGPIILGMLTFAPVVIRLLYAPEFAPSAAILRWQVAGDLLKVISWPLGFIIMAKGAGSTLFLSELVWNVSYILGVWTFLSRYGLVVTGSSFLAAYAVLLFVIYAIVRSGQGFRYDSGNMRLFALVCSLALLISVAALWSEVVVYTVGTICSAGLGIYSIGQLRTLAKPQNH